MYATQSVGWVSKAVKRCQGNTRAVLLAVVLTLGFLTAGTAAQAGVLPGAHHGTRLTRGTIVPVTVPAGSLLAGKYTGETLATSNSIGSYLAQGYVCLQTGQVGTSLLTYTCFLPA